MFKIFKYISDIFDYIYYRLVRIVGIRTGLPEINAAAILSLFQTFNIETLLYFLFPALPVEVFAITYFPLYVILHMFNGVILYFKSGEKYYRRINKCKERWDNEPKKIKRLRGILVFVYFIASFLLFCILLSSRKPL